MAFIEKTPYFHCVYKYLYQILVSLLLVTLCPSIVIFCLWSFWTSFLPIFCLSCLYAFWMLYDNLVLKTPFKGGRLRRDYSSNKYLKMYANYFPATLHKTVDLDPRKTYVFGIHPHGVMCISGFLNIISDATGFSEKFPGLTVRSVALNMWQWFPLFRELLLLGGVSSANKETVEYILTQYGPGSCCAIPIGGAKEVIYAIPNTMELVLKNRKGFVRLAIKHGASLVPCLSFGENELFNCPKKCSETSLYRQLQYAFYKVFGVPFFIYYGSGLLWMMPNQKPLNTIVGRPIDTTKNPTPTEEDVDRVHLAYMDALEKLFNENKAKFAEDKNMKIVFK